MRTFLPIAAASLLAACSSGGEYLPADGECGPGYELGDCPPDFTLPDSTGMDQSLSGLSGDVTVVWFSAFW